MDGWNIDVIEALGFAIITKPLQTNQPTDQWTNRWADITSYRYAIAASKKIPSIQMLAF